MAIKELLVRITGDGSGFSQAIREANSELSTFGRAIDRNTGGFTRLGQSLQTIGAGLTAAVSVPLAGVGLASLKMAAQLETAQTAFTTMMKNADAARQHLESLKKFAVTTPFQFTELVDASRKMQALGFSATEVVPKLRIIGDAVGALGLGAEGLNRVILALGQMRAKGTAQAEEMRQLAEAGIPAWEALAKKIGTDIPTAMDLVKKRAIDSKTAIDAVLESMQTRFGGGMEAQAKTLEGIFSNVIESLKLTAAEIGSTFAPAIKDALNNGILPLLNRLKELSQEFAALPSGVQTTALAIGGIAIIAPPVIVALGTLIRNWKEIAVTIAGARLALAGFSAALSSPVVLTIGAISAAAYAGKKAWDALSESAVRAKQTAFGSQAAAIVRQQAPEALAPIAEANKPPAITPVSLGTPEVTKHNIEVLSLAETWARVKKAEEDARLELEFMTLLTKSAAWREGWTPIISAEPVIRTMPEHVDSLAVAVGLLNDQLREQAPSLWFDSWTKGSSAMSQVEQQFQMMKRSFKLDTLDLGLKKPDTRPLIEVSTILTNMSQGIADVVFNWKSAGDTFKRISIEIGKSILANVIQKGIQPLISGLTSLLGNIPGLGGIFGGATKSVGSTFSGLGSALSGAASSVIGVVGNLASAISGIIGNFQAAKTNSLLKEIGSGIRGLVSNSIDLNQRGMNEFMSALPGIHDRLKEIRQLGVRVFTTDNELAVAGLVAGSLANGAGGPITINNYFGFGTPNQMADDIVKALKQRL